MTTNTRAELADERIKFTLWAATIERDVRVADLTNEEVDRLLSALRGQGEGWQAIEDVWRQARENHANYSATGDKETDLRFFALGLSGEAGELANFVKKRWRDGDGHDEAIRYEIADVCAYAFMAADCMGMSPADLIATIAEKQQVFIAKMRARQPLPAPPSQTGGDDGR